MLILELSDIFVLISRHDHMLFSGILHVFVLDNMNLLHECCLMQEACLFSMFLPALHVCLSVVWTWNQHFRMDCMLA